MPFPADPNYLQSIQGLHRLHALALSGEDESAEADAIRDRLERPWAALTEIERKRIAGLSADLYSLSESQSPARPGHPQIQWIIVEAVEASVAGEWDHALELLRQWADYIEPAVLTRLRASIWTAAGDTATAALFLERARELNPGSIADLGLSQPAVP